MTDEHGSAGNGVEGTVARPGGVSYLRIPARDVAQSAERDRRRRPAGRGGDQAALRAPVPAQSASHSCNARATPPEQQAGAVTDT
jgi:hypothetical protein